MTIGNIKLLVMVRGASRSGPLLGPEHVWAKCEIACVWEPAVIGHGGLEKTRRLSAREFENEARYCWRCERTIKSRPANERNRTRSHSMEGTSADN